MVTLLPDFPDCRSGQRDIQILKVRPNLLDDTSRHLQQQKRQGSFAIIQCTFHQYERRWIGTAGGKLLWCASAFPGIYHENCPQFGANYIKGKIRAQPNGGWTGETKFKLAFKSGGCIDFGQALLRAASMAQRNSGGMVIRSYQRTHRAIAKILSFLGSSSIHTTDERLVCSSATILRGDTGNLRMVAAEFQLWSSASRRRLCKSPYSDLLPLILSARTDQHTIACDIRCTISHHLIQELTRITRRRILRIQDLNKDSGDNSHHKWDSPGHIRHTWDSLLAA